MRAAGVSSGLGHAVAPREALGSFVEVTGLRVTVDQKSRSRVQYIVVNHSAAAVSNLALRIAVRSALASSPEPLFTISALLTGLGPFASREVVTDIEDPRAANIPEWQYLRTEVQIVPQ